jgi:Ca2+-binding RTX toxin-like protein
MTTTNQTNANQTKINFQDQSAGTIINGQYTAQGVTISSANGYNPPMIFDTAHPTGGDTDLATSNLGNVLILSEDGDSSDPDDNAGGGTFRFDFDGEVTVDSITLLDVEEGAWIKVFDEHGRLLEQIDARTADNGQLTVNIDTPGAAFMTIQLAGSGAVDNLKFTPVAQLDGVVNGTAGGDLIDTAYVDAQGDRIDANDALGVEGTTGDEDLVLAGGGNDTVYAGAGDDIVRGEDGYDRLFGQSGNDVLDGGAGNDRLIGGTGNDTLLGGSGRDSIFGGDGDDQIDGGTGDDRIEGGDGADFIQGGDGNDLIVGFDAKSIASGGTEVLTDDGANDTLLGGAGYDTVLGGKGDDLIDGGAGADMLFGGDDRDTFVNVTSGDMIDGGEGGDDFDTLDLTGANAAVEFDADNPENGVIFFLDDNGDRTGETAKFANIENVINAVDERDGIVSGTDAGELIDVDFIGDPDGDRVDNGDALLPGEAGDDDIIQAGGGDDTILSGAGDDEIDAGEGNDLVDAGDGDDLVQGGDGDDTIDGGTGQDTLNGDGGNDVISGSADDDVINGGAGDDTISGGDGNDTIDGGDGSDVLEGGRDDDVITGGDGDDTLRGNGGNDTLDGGAGDDSVSGSANDDLLFGGDGNDEVSGSGGNDTLDGGAGDDEVRGGRGDDKVEGGDGNDIVTGGDGDDMIGGGAGNDTIIGGAGMDMIDGGDDRDIIFGATTGDMIDGGAGGDDFDTLDLTGSDVAFITFDPDNGENGVITFRDETTAKFQDIESVVPCFTPGTQIATPKGEIAVEDLVVGDRVITRDNGIQVIRWIGRRDLTAADLTVNDTLRAVMIRQGALGYGLPERDMIVSPQHRILISNDETMLYFDEREVLVAAKHLVGRPGVERMDATDISYIHVMFDNHEVILSDGAWTESFQPGDHSLKGLGKAQREEIFAIFPELREEEGLEEYTAARRMLRRQEAELLVR